MPFVLKMGTILSSKRDPVEDTGQKRFRICSVIHTELSKGKLHK